MLKISRADECPACGKNRKPVAPTREQLSIEESCGRDGRATYIITLREHAKLNIPSLIKIVEEKGYPVKGSSKFSISFDYDSRTRICIMQSGSGVAQVTPPRSETDNEHILLFYKSLIEELGKH
jgi:hypothetical protein